MVCGFAGNLCAVVATYTGSVGIDMVERCRDRGGRSVAVLAGVCGRQMRGTLACRLCPVVTAVTGSRDAAVVEGRRNPCGRAMAILPRIAG